MSDFEQALISAISSVFPGVYHVGCFLHFAQAVYRKMSQMGVRMRYEEDPAFKEAVKCLIALGHVPAASKHAYFFLLMADYATDPDFVLLGNSYFYPTWFQRYPLQSRDWHLVSTRTNNHVEGYHSGLKHLFKMPHLSFYKFMDDLLKEQIENVKNKFQKCVLGLRMPKPTKLQVFYSERNERIMNLHRAFNERVPIDYLIAIARCVPKPAVFPQNGA